MMKQILTFFLFLTLFSGLNAQQSPRKDHSMLSINCKTCHSCDVPTKSDPCLVVCPRNEMVTVYEAPEKTPEMIVIDQLSDRYGPVYFLHKIHAQMSVMSGGCETCHHHNTSGPILKCNSCHETSRKREDVRLPDLMGAFHRQCIDCHREWSHQTACDYCHTLKTDLIAGKDKNLQKEYAGKDHPLVLEPTRITYQTNSDKGKIVSFYHNDHTKRFGLNCIDCHKQENCTKCHDVNKTDNNLPKTVVTKESFEEQHKYCINCHSEDKCSSCHSNTILEPFNHKKKTGWALNKYHINLSCSGCHKKSKEFTRLDKKCISCHPNWNSMTFTHKVTGLVLDENHIELECSDCHLDGDFSKKPSCSNCHDDKSYPNDKPGKLVK